MAKFFDRYFCGQGYSRENADLPRRGTSVNILVSIRIELGALNIID